LFLLSVVLHHSALLFWSPSWDSLSQTWITPSVSGKCVARRSELLGSRPSAFSPQILGIRQVRVAW
jgi:hypothetical protein